VLGVAQNSALAKEDWLAATSSVSTPQHPSNQTPSQAPYHPIVRVRYTYETAAAIAESTPAVA
jgi:hypothetical protein